jgi:protein-tyrosine phosphatase
VTEPPKIRIAFVCLGNICRSPTAEGVFVHLIDREGLAHRFHVESAGTAAYHVGERPDRRSREAAARRGIELRGRAQRFEAADFARFDHVLAMDGANLRDLLDRAPHPSARAKVRRLREFDDASVDDLDVPDPYYGGPRGFDDVLDICERGCLGLLAHLRRTHDL